MTLAKFHFIRCHVATMIEDLFQKNWIHTHAAQKGNKKQKGEKEFTKRKIKGGIQSERDIFYF